MSYEDGFVVDYDHTLRRSINCKDCVYFENSDKSCCKTSKYLPEDGFDSWKRCDYFEISPSVSHYKEKVAKLNKWRNEHSRKRKKKNNWQPVTNTKKPKSFSVPTKEELTTVRLHSRKYGNGRFSGFIGGKMIVTFDDGRKEEFFYPSSFKNGSLFVNKNCDLESV